MLIFQMGLGSIDSENKIVPELLKHLWYQDEMRRYQKMTGGTVEIYSVIP